MQFAKLFDFECPELPQGQLLAQVSESNAREEADAPYQLVLKTMSELGTCMTLTYGYADEALRDAEFIALTPLAAEGHYQRMQATLLHATTPLD